METNNPISIYITIGESKAIGLDDYNNLVILDLDSRTKQINLGPFTQKRAKELGQYLQQLSIHTPER